MKMTFNFDKFSKDIASLKVQDDFSVYLESCFIELEEYLLNISNDEIKEIKFDMKICFIIYWITILY